ncbi:MAG: IS1 family transposase [Candidatus Poribacteria bacterium]
MRWNLTLRQRLARFVRETLCFSKSDFFHNRVLNFSFITTICPWHERQIKSEASHQSKLYHDPFSESFSEKCPCSSPTPDRGYALRPLGKGDPEAGAQSALFLLCR